MEEQTPKKFHFTKQMKIGLAVVLVLCIGCGLVYLDTAWQRENPQSVRQIQCDAK